MNNKPLCMAPFTNLLVDSNENIKPCPVYQPKSALNINNYFNSEEIKELQYNLIHNDTLPNQCQVCKNNETEYGSSLRVTKQKLDTDQRIYEPGNFHIDVILVSTSNACNLKCMPCSYSSYPRIKELADLDFVPAAGARLFYLDRKNFSWVADIIERYNISVISLMGGEPFYDKVTMDLIDELINRGLSTKLQLNLTTNATNLNQQKIEKIKKSYKKFELDCSVDGVEAVHEYLRYPSKWNQILQSLKILKDLDQTFNIRTAFSNLVLLRYPDLVMWALENNIQNLYLCSVDDPVIMNPQRLPIGLQDYINKKYEQLKYLNVSTTTKESIKAATGYAANLNEHGFKGSLEFFYKHDKHRGNSLLEVFQELKPYV